MARKRLSPLLVYACTCRSLRQKQQSHTVSSLDNALLSQGVLNSVQFACAGVTSAVEEVHLWDELKTAALFSQKGTVQPHQIANVLSVTVLVFLSLSLFCLLFCDCPYI